MLGIDIETISRFEHLIKNKPNVIKKFFYPYEWEYAQNKARMAQTLTGIWCAKEAVVKAFSGLENLAITDVEIRHKELGNPYVFNIVNQSFIEKYEILISISHAKDYANAVAYITLK